MKKTLLTAALIAALSATTLSANAFCWSNLNPFTWGSRCCGAAANCECPKDKCKPSCKKTKSCCPVKNKCQTEKPKCNTCAPAECSPCDRLQQETER